jgi:iron complex outermembrane receptor protein
MNSSRAALALTMLCIASTRLQAQTADGQALPNDSGKGPDDIVVTARLANASINGIAIDPLRLPQNVRVLDSALIEASGATRIDDLLDLSGSVARQNNFGGLWDNYAIRGFSGDINGGPDLLINRFTSNRGYNAARDVATVELFQVLKGPASALSGKGEPGGSINIVTKAPLDRDHFGGQIEGGSFDHYRGVLDIGGRVSGALGVRMIAVREDNGSFRDFVSNDRILIAPSVAFDPSERLHFLYQLEYSVTNSTFDRGVVALPRADAPLEFNGRALPRSRFLGEPADSDVTLRSTQHQSSFRSELAGDVALEGGVQYRDGTLRGFASEGTSRVGSQLRRRRQLRDFAFDDLSGRIELAAMGNFLQLNHQFRVGGDAYTYDLDQRIDRTTVAAAGGAYAIDVLTPVYGQPLPVPAPFSNTREEQRGEGVYAQDLLTFGESVSLLLGVRHDWVRQRVTNKRTGVTTSQSQSVTSPRAALTIAPSDALSFYASYGKSFRFNQGVDAASQSFAPERGEAYEGGVKYALLDGRMTGTLSAFRITKSNILVSDPAASGFSIPVGRARSQGLEADVNVRLSRSLDLTAVYALADTEVLADRVARPVPQPIPAGTELSNVPRHSGSLFAQWRSSQEPSRYFTVGSGLTYVGDREGTPAGTTATEGRFRLPGYVTARASIGYQISGAIGAYAVIDNVFDRYYLASSFNELWVAPGTPRAIRVGLRVGL